MAACASYFVLRRNVGRGAEPFLQLAVRIVERCRMRLHDAIAAIAPPHAEGESDGDALLERFEPCLMDALAVVGMSEVEPAPPDALRATYP